MCLEKKKWAILVLWNSKERNSSYIIPNVHEYVSILYSDGGLIASNNFIVYVLPFPFLIKTIILLCCRNWELTAPWTGAKVKVPVKFIVGDLDLTYNSPGAKDYIHKGGLKRDVPLLEDVVVIQGAGHFVHQERPDEITKHIYDFVKKF